MTKSKKNKVKSKSPPKVVKPPSYPDHYFLEYINSTKTLKDASKVVYLCQIDKVTMKFWDSPKTIWWVLTHPEEFHTALDRYASHQEGKLGNHCLSPASKVQFTRIMMSLFNNHPELRENHMDLIKQWHLMKDEIARPVDDHYLSGEKTERQKEGFVPFAELERLRDALPDGSMERLLMSMYTLIYPLRADFDSIRLYREPPKSPLPNENYLDLEHGVLVIQKFKTDKIYQPITVHLGSELMNQIRLSLKQNPRDYLFVNRFGLPFTVKGTYANWSNYLLKRVTGKPRFSLTTFRHAFLSQEHPNDPVAKEALENGDLDARRKIAKEMGHSVSQSFKYQFKDEKGVA